MTLERIAELQYEAGFYQCLYESAIKRFEQIAIVCADNMDRDCNHRMALDFVRQIANAASPLTSPDPVGWGGHLPGKIEP